MIEVKCQGCGKAYRFKDESLLPPLAGAKVKCPACSAIMEIPSREEAPPPAGEIPSPQEREEHLPYERAPLTPVQDLDSNTIERGTIFPITRVFTLVIIGLLALSWCVVIVRLLLPSESSGAGFLSEDPIFSALWNPKVLAGLAYTIITLVLIAVFALVLVLLAIERNTRPRTGSEVAQQVRGKE